MGPDVHVLALSDSGAWMPISYEESPRQELPSISSTGSSDHGSIRLWNVSLAAASPVLALDDHAGEAAAAPMYRHATYFQVMLFEVANERAPRSLLDHYRQCYSACPGARLAFGCRRP